MVKNMFCPLISAHPHSQTADADANIACSANADADADADIACTENADADADADT